MYQLLTHLLNSYEKLGTLGRMHSVKVGKMIFCDYFFFIDSSQFVKRTEYKLTQHKHPTSKTDILLLLKKKKKEKKKKKIFFYSQIKIHLFPVELYFSFLINWKLKWDKKKIYFIFIYNTKGFIISFYHLWIIIFCKIKSSDWNI